MARNIKNIAHDLSPLTCAITELSSIVSEILCNIKTHAFFDDPKVTVYFNECYSASEKLTITARLMKRYVDLLDEEADKEGVTKN